MTASGAGAAPDDPPRRLTSAREGFVMSRYVIAAAIAAASLLAAPAEAQLTRSACADCHFARPEAPAQDHLLNWERSPHGRNNVGCATGAIRPPSNRCRRTPRFLPPVM
jgi:hypothetical protein